ncbi:hypothetical protein [Sphingomonas profundi]|uniref:hypothetical protein n=1 Tax=Alterirhizorhabdus profundi TaxID=2681549 RepID=UPI0012E762E2|nr:hypothetical protein [Sphingomonas profundi]
MTIVTVTDLLRTIDATLAEKVAPSVGDVGGRSALATVRHLLNFVRVRVEREGQTLVDDIAALQRLLIDLRGYLAGVGDSAMADGIADTLGMLPPPDSARYRALDELAADAAVLRETLHVALAFLQRVRDTRRDDPAYRAARAAIRAYTVRQIEQEGEIVAPAFFGRGPRR